MIILIFSVDILASKLLARALDFMTIFLKWILFLILRYANLNFDFQMACIF